MIQGLAGSLMTSRPDPVSSTLIRNWLIAILDDSRFWPEAGISTAPALGPVLFSAFDPKRAFAPLLAAVVEPTAGSGLRWLVNRTQAP